MKIKKERICIRLDGDVLSGLKKAADQKRVPYQTLINLLLAQALKKGLWLSVLIMLFVTANCGVARGGRAPRAELLFIDQPGYKCFGIRNEDDALVGGNCLKE